VTVTAAIDDELLARARECSGLEDIDALLRYALQAIVQREAARRLAALGGTSPGLRSVPRRRS
jgi:Arc/MetJ family transcription regulator